MSKERERREKERKEGREDGCQRDIQTLSLLAPVRCTVAK